MRPRLPSRRHARQSLALPSVLALAGITCVAVAFAAQQQPRQPALSVVTPTPARTATPSVSATPSNASKPAVLPSSPPVAVAIPAIGVRSSLLRLGQAADGSMQVPQPGPDYDRAGWYRYSPTPGSLGPAVIVGHIDSAKNGPSVFFRLAELRPGDTVSVTRVDGSVAVFAVDAVRRFRKTDFPTQLVYGNTDHAALRLITCGGPFDRVSRHYLDNIVVTASLVTSA